MARNTTKIGDIFSVNISENENKYFQYVTNDPLQLNSDVIRTFETIYKISDSPTLLDIINGKVDFFAHCVTKLGIKMNLWNVIGNVPYKERVIIFFRASNDYGSKPGEQVKISHNWRIWQIGDTDFKRVEKLEGENRGSEIGIVVSPIDIVTRMKTGSYDFFYPDFE